MEEHTENDRQDTAGAAAGGAAAGGMAAGGAAAGGGADVYELLASLSICSEVARTMSYLVENGCVTGSEDVSTLVSFALASMADRLAGMHDSLEACWPE